MNESGHAGGNTRQATMGLLYSLNDNSFLAPGNNKGTATPSLTVVSVDPSRSRFCASWMHAIYLAVIRASEQLRLLHHFLNVDV